ncbi:MAG: putative Ig domain-containing protein [Steroidobacteraceae bacterium]
MTAPSDLAYPQPPAFVISKAITPLTPTVTGQVNRYDVSPALPQGLSINVSTGVISGTPIVITPKTTYTVSAANTGGSTTATMSITVTNVAPVAAYASAYYAFTAGVPAQTINPTTSGGAVVTWSVTPALPAGLVLSPTDGSISGTPTAASAPTSYLISAANTGGVSNSTVTIAVAAAPLLNLGLDTPVTVLRYVNSSVLSQDQSYNWLLQNYASGTTLASGIGAGAPVSMTPGTYVDLEASVMIDGTGTALEIRSATSGAAMATIPAPTGVRWYRLATDGSYVVAGSATALTAWSTTGAQLFSIAGNYANANAFAAPGKVQVALGAAGAQVIQTVAVPSGAATVSPTFSGTFDSWFTDGARFLTTLGLTTIWTYSAAAVQQDITSVATTAGLGGEGNWFWTFDQYGGLNIYQVGHSQTPTISQSFSVVATAAVPAASTLAILSYAPETGVGPAPLTVFDLSGATPSSTTYSVPFVSLSAYGAISPTQWLVGTGYGVIYDGASPAGHPRTLTFGSAWSIAAGTSYISVATASGQILYFNASDDSLAGTINFSSSALSASADGSVLIALANSFASISNDNSLNLYELPLNTPVTTFSNSNPSPGLWYVALSATGTEIAEQFYGPPCLTQVISTTGTTILCYNPTSYVPPDEVNSVTLSPDGTLIAASTAPSTTVTTNIYKNGTLTTAVPGYAVGWINNTELLVQNFINDMETSGANEPMGTAIYNAQGQEVGATPLQAVTPFMPVSGLSVYVILSNTIVSLQTGDTAWASGNAINHLGGEADPANLGAITGTQVVFASGNRVLAQPY